MENEVVDENNFPEAIDAMQTGLEVGFAAVYHQSLNRLIDNMAKGQDALGRPWEPLAPETIQAKGHSTPLIDSGNLRSDIQDTSSIDLAELRAIIGTSTEYGAVHEFGMPERGIPQRSFLQPTGKYAENISKGVIGSEIDSRLKNAEL